MSTAPGCQPILASTTNDAQDARPTTSLVPSKRKALIDSSPPQRCLRPIIEEGNSKFRPRGFVADRAKNEHYTYSAYTDAELDEAYTNILEEEEDIRIQAELESVQYTASIPKKPTNKRNLFDKHDDRVGYDESRQYYRHNSEDLENAFLKVLEEEEDIRAQAELGIEQYTLSKVEKEFDDNSSLFEHDALGGLGEDLYQDETDYLGTKDDEYFETRMRSRPSYMSIARYQYGLCEPCRAVRWSILPRLRLHNSHLVCKLRGSPLKLQESRCRVCNFLGTIGFGKVSPDDPRDEEVYLDLTLTRSYAKYAKILSMTLNGGMDQSLITIHSTKDNKKWRPPLIEPEAIDYGTLRQIFARCRHEHGDSCSPRSGAQLEGFKVIDCHLRKVIPAPSGCQYVALSYVWGGHSESDGFPLTIEDSFRVTKGMGYNYLWVDRYV
jgi:hypothetical protein